MNSLNPEQLKAVKSDSSYISIIAGPGTGKTKTLTSRIVHLIQDKKVSPDRILALTFTNKAASEMQTRISKDISKQQIPTVTTFHGFSHQLLNNSSQFIDEVERLAIIKELPKPDSISDLPIKEIALQISRYKNSTDLSEFDPGIERLAKRYDQKLKEYNLEDFDNLLIQAKGLLIDNKQKFSHLLVDEFQDTNDLQYQIMKLINADNILVIGDPFQSIYGFRGANSSIFRRFQKDYQPEIITLKTNYRSTKSIIDLAKETFPEVKIEPNSKEVGEVKVIKTLNEYAESQYIVDQIESKIGGTNFLSASNNEDRSISNFRDFAIIYRTHRSARAIIKQLSNSGIPYQIAGQESPFALPIFKKLIKLTNCTIKKELPDQRELKILDLNQNIISKIQNLDLNNKQPSEILEYIAKELDLVEKLNKHQETLRRLNNILLQFNSNQKAIEHLQMLIENNYYDPRADSVTLLTIHAAKGLEFPQVFLCASEEDTLPHSRKGTDIEEEKRLFYVAITRAKKYLDITYTTERAHQKVRPSRFIKTLSHIQDSNLESQQKRRKKQAIKKAQGTLFDI